MRSVKWHALNVSNPVDLYSRHVRSVSVTVVVPSVLLLVLNASILFALVLTLHVFTNVVLKWKCFIMLSVTEFARFERLVCTALL